MYGLVLGFFARHLASSAPSFRSSSADLCLSSRTEQPLIKPKGQELNPIYPHAPLVAHKSNEYVGGEPGAAQLSVQQGSVSLRNVTQLICGPLIHRNRR